MNFEKLKGKVVRKDTILTDEEIDNLPMSKVLNNVVEHISEEQLLSFGLVTNELLTKLHGNNGKRKLVCSVYAGHSEAVNAFERLLSKVKKWNIKKLSEDKIARIGLIGYWHYFVECEGQMQATLEDDIKYEYGGIKVAELSSYL